MFDGCKLDCGKCSEKGESVMKKNVLIGIFLPLFYFLINNIIRYAILSGEYNEEYALLHYALIIALPALPGISLIFLLIRNSIKEYFRSLNVCFWISFAVIILYLISGIELMIHTKITGYKEIGLGDSVLSVITMEFYLASCLIGAIIAGVITFFKRKKSISTEGK